MSDTQNSSGNGTAAPQRRRLSIAEMFNPRPSNTSSSPPGGITPAAPDIAQHRRGSSISSLGFGGTNQSQPSPYNAFARQRAASISGSSAASSPEFKNSFTDEHAVIEEDESSKSAFGSPPSPSFARRLSFGAQALRDVRQTGQNASNGNRRPSSSLYTLNEDKPAGVHVSSRSFEAAQARGEGFNWSESLRDQTKRSPSFSTANPFTVNLGRAKSNGVGSGMEPPKEIPKAAPALGTMKKPDHLGERMLRGDFMMD